MGEVGESTDSTAPSGGQQPDHRLRQAQKIERGYRLEDVRVSRLQSNQEMVLQDKESEVVARENKRVETSSAARVLMKERGIRSDLLETILETAKRLFSPNESLPSRQLEELIIEAIASSDGNYGISEAIKWAGGFVFPQELVDSDLRLFRASQLDFTVMVARRLKQLGADRLSRSRVERLREDNPERSRLFDIANGMRVPLPAGFIPNGKGLSTPLRPAYVQVHQAVDKMLADLHAQGLAFCLQKKEAIELIEGLHLGKASWTPKKGKACGRSIGDMSYCDGTPLNCDEAKQMGETWWGEIELPTIDTVVIMVLEFFTAELLRDPASKWSDLRLWKTDLRAAYQLLSVRPDNAKYFAMEIFGDRVFIHLCGIFGWTCTPAAFQVVSRGI